MFGNIFFKITELCVTPTLSITSGRTCPIQIYEVTYFPVFLDLLCSASAPCICPECIMKRKLSNFIVWAFTHAKCCCRFGRKNCHSYNYPLIDWLFVCWGSWNLWLAAINNWRQEVVFSMLSNVLYLLQMKPVYYSSLMWTSCPVWKRKM